MKSKNLNSKSYILRLEKGEEIISSLLDFCTKNKIKAGHLHGLGSITEVVLAHYMVDNKKFSEKEFDDIYEAASLFGIISHFQNKPHFHVHAAIADDKFKVFAGHLKKAVTAATCEILIIKSQAKLTRYHDNEIGLDLLAIERKNR